MNRLAFVLTVFLLPWGVHARDVAPPVAGEEKLAAPAEKVSIVLFLSNEKQYIFRVTNNTTKAFTDPGYSPEMPIYQIKEHPVGWCGTGVMPQTLKPGHSFTFKVHRTMIRNPKTKEIHVEVGGVTSPRIPLE